MDLEKFLAVSLLAQFGVAVWLTSGEREKNPIPGNIFIAFLVIGFLTFAMGLLNAFGSRMAWIALALAGLIVAHATTKKPPKLFDYLLRTYSLAFVAGVGAVAALLMVVGKRPQEQAVETIRTVTMLSVILNDLSIVAFLAVLPDRPALLRFFAAFMVPGLGHFLQGKRNKAIFFFLSISAVYVTGLAMTSWRMVGREDNPFYWYGQFFSGFTTVIGLLLPAGKAHLPEGWSYTHFDPGLLYVCAAALLNYVVSLNVFEFKAPSPEPPKEPPKEVTA